MTEFFKFVIRFFRGGRRKFGVVTLLLALVALSWSFLGHFIQVGYPIVVGREVNDFDLLSNGLTWMHFSVPEGTAASFKDNSGLKVFLKQPFQFLHHLNARWHCDNSDLPFDVFANQTAQWHWQFCGFHVADLNANEIGFLQSSILIVPYWSIVLPLTLISAYQLLSKPRKSHQTKLIEPTIVEGG